MDGLIPLVCRAFKKSKTRGNYEYLSSGTAQSYNASDFLVSADHVPSLYNNPRSESREGGHRRYMSTAGDFASERYNSSAIMGRSSSMAVAGGGGVGPRKQQEMVRFRSHRRLFGCVGLAEE